MYAHRRIKVSFSGEGGAGSGLIFEGLRTIARITKSGGEAFGTAQIIIFGLSLSHKNQLSTWGTNYRPNQQRGIVVEAGDDINGMSVVFAGTVYQAWADFTGMPTVPMYFLASGTTANANVGTMQPTSTSGPTPVAPLIQKAALFSGQSFENSGVNAVVDGVYHWGSPWKQMKEMADAVRVNIFQDDGTVAIWPQGEPRQGDTLLVSKKTGMRDYPSFTTYGVQVKVEFSRAIKYGTNMVIKSALTAANGTWQIVKIDYDLNAEVPNGNWFAILDGVLLGTPVTVGPL